MDRLPKYLYYYTTVDTLRKIIENRTLWLGDYRFLNDESELAYAIKVARDCVDEMEMQCNNTLYKYNPARIRTEIDRIERNELMYYMPTNDKMGFSKGATIARAYSYHAGRYILSLSKNRDDKNMWVIYGNKELGCRLKFDTNELVNYIEKAFNNEYGESLVEPFLLLAKVNYSPKAIKNALRGLNFQIRCGDMYTNQNSIFKILISSKNYTYKDENEYRIVCSYCDDREELLKSGHYRITAKDDGPKIKKVYGQYQNAIKPFIEINHFPIEKIIKEIMISPYNKSYLAKEGLRDLIYHETKKEISIVPSEIVIR